MSPVLEEIRRTAETRLLELAPLLAEAQQLRDLLSALDDPDGLAAAELADGSVSSLQLARAHDGVIRGGRAPQGANKRLILGIIAGRPGIAAPEIAALTGLKRTVVASTVSRLKRTGELEACGGGVRLPDTRAAHAAA
jgi:hypothetical protein